MRKSIARAGLTGSLLLFMLLAGCATSATQYAPLPPDLQAPPEPGKARICVIRGFALAAMAVECPLQEDGVPRGSLINASYICWERPPGEVRLSMPAWDVLTYKGNLPVEPGMVYYLYMDYLSPQLKSITAKEGLKYLTEYSRPRVVAGRAAPYASPGQGAGAPIIGNQAGGVQGGGPSSPSQNRVGY